MSVPNETDVGSDLDEEPRWRTAKASGGSGQCVEVAPGRKRVGIRDSKAPDEGEFWVPRASFDALQDLIAPDRKKK